MPEEIKKVLIVALEGVSGSDVYEAAKAGKLANIRRLIGDGTVVPGVVVDACAASSWATLATGAHVATHGVTAAGQTSKAQYIWQAAEKASKRGLLLGLAASALPAYHEDHPAELVSPANADAAYFDRVGSYLLSSPDWDIAFVHVPAGSSLREADEAAGKALDAADFETLRVLVAVPATEGDGLLVLEGPGVKRGKVVERPVELADVAPTICTLAELPIPADCEGGVIYQAMDDPDGKLVELQACRRNYERLRRSSGSTPMC